MRQPPIDLMPDFIRARSLAGVVAGRYVAAFVLAIGVLLAPATHARLALADAEAQRDLAKQEAAVALEIEDDYHQKLADLATKKAKIHRYEIVAMPLDVHRIIATIVNELPDSVSLDSLEMSVEWGTPRSPIALARTAVAKTASAGSAAAKEPPPRYVRGELAGFAHSQEDVANLTANLKSLGLCDNVEWHFSHKREVRGHLAREFRISFRIGLEARFVVTDRDEPGRELSHVQ